MSLILAIEPDRRQVAHLISIVRHVTGAELVLADTTERALESIGNGVPDLILVPALLSPQDDAALAAALRVIATAAHVQMLTIPTFSAGKARPKSRGMLSAFLRKSADDGPVDGCDPKVFAEQITSYLERATEERAAAQLLEDNVDEMAGDTFAAPQQAFDDPPPGFEDIVASTFEETPAATAPSIEDAIVPELEAETLSVAPLVEDTYAEPMAEMSNAAAPAQPAPAPEELVELVERFEQAEPPVEAEYQEPTPEISIAAAPPQPMALEEFVAALERTEPPSVADAQPEPLVMTAATTAVNEDESVELDIDLTIELEEARPEMAFAASPTETLPALDDLLADFERADMPVIEEVHAEQWMEAAQPKDDDEPTQADIDLSIELASVLHVEQPSESVEPAASLKQFEPMMPVERFEPFPLAAWQNWPRLEGTGSTAPHENGPDDSAGADSQIAEFEAALFEAAHQEEEALERFEPVVPVESLEPLPLAAWQCWPRLEGVMAEAYQEPIAPRKAVAKPEWVELMRSLREDIARKRAELASSAPQPAPAPQKPQAPLPQAAKPAAAPAVAADPLKKRPKRTRPIEDEWGLFDPEQCGFAALLDKLDEITVPPPSSHPRR
jgi:hypothetical protein